MFFVQYLKEPLLCFPEGSNEIKPIKNMGPFGVRGKTGLPGEGGEEGRRLIRSYDEYYQKTDFLAIAEGIRTNGVRPINLAMYNHSRSGWNQVFQEGDVPDRFYRPEIHKTLWSITVAHQDKTDVTIYLRPIFEKIGPKTNGSDGNVVTGTSLDIPQNPLFTLIDTEKYLNSFDMYLKKQPYGQRYQATIQKTRQDIDTAQKKNASPQGVYDAITRLMEYECRANLSSEHLIHEWKRLDDRASLLSNEGGNPLVYELRLATLMMLNYYCTSQYYLLELPLSIRQTSAS